MLTSKINLTFCFIIISIMVTEAGIPQSDAPASAPNLTVSLISEKIHLDGRLDESSWQFARFTNFFYQREPGDGTTPTERTEVGCVYDQNQLYLGIRCFDSQPEKIVRSELRRDAYMDHEDYFELVLDTFLDFRNAFYFIFNANGNMRDARISDEGRTFNSNWDGIWECRARITDQGWFAELAIPWKTLRFAQTDSFYFGINFGRMIRRKNERLEWVNSPRELGTFGLFRLSLAGRVGPFVGIQAGGNIELKPFITSALQQDLETAFRTQTIHEFGFDGKANFSSNLIADLTWNTDFAQVEADQEQVNLTRFSLYFPEKRDFFLEGAEIFRTESSVNSISGQNDDLILFYSRKIGIDEGYPIPLLGGLKLCGKIQRMTLGALSMQTKGHHFAEDFDLPATRYDVLRLRQDLFDRSAMGLLLTNKSGGRQNQTVTADFRLAPAPQLVLSGILTGSRTSDSSNYRNCAGNFTANWNSDRYQFEAGFTEIEPHFNAETGFIQRRNIRKSNSSFYFTPRAGGASPIRKYTLGFWGSYLTNTQNVLRERYFGIELGVELQSSTKIKLQISREYDSLVSDWELRPNLFIPARVYEATTLYLLWVTNISKPVSGISRLTVSDYYTGSRYAFGGEIICTGFSRIRLHSAYDFNRIVLPEKSFGVFTLSTRIVYAFSTRFYLKAYVQYNQDRLRFANRLKLSHNFLIRYIFRPGSSFYLVYNHQKLFGADQTETLNRTLLVKLVYFWRK